MLSDSVSMNIMIIFNNNNTIKSLRGNENGHHNGKQRVWRSVYSQDDERGRLI